jgi:hypothetical protein
MNLSLIVNDLKNTIDRNSPAILTAMAVGGVVTTIALTIRGTIRARDLYAQEIDWRYHNFEGEDIPFPTPKEVIELTWKEYIPTVAAGAFTIACTIGANHISSRRTAALASLFTLTEKALQEYQAKVVDTIGEKKEALIQGEIAQDKLDKNPPEKETIILTGNGDFLCYDAFSDRYFRSNVSFIERKVNEFNHELLKDGWRNLNDFYYELGLGNIELGDELGWYADRDMLDVKQSTKMAKDQPCLVISFRVQPNHI